MSQDRRAEPLQEEIAAVLACLSGKVEFLAKVKEAVANASQGIATGAGQEPPWPLLPLIICEAICGRSERALPAAASGVFFKAAAEVFDDVEDADSPDSLASKYGTAVATNVATALLFLGEKALLRLKERGIDDDRIVKAFEIINSHYLKACAGQHADIGLTSGPISEGRYLQMIAMKTASQLECSCRIGALLGDGKQNLIDTFSKVGNCLGMMAQIANDIRGITAGNDIAARKISLPVIYTLDNADELARERIAAAFFKNVDSVTDPDEIKELLFKTGALQYAVIRMETYRQEGLDKLREAGKMGARIDSLGLFFN